MLVAVHRRAEIQAQHAANLVVERGHVGTSVGQTLKIWSGKIIITVGIGFAIFQAVGPRSEFQVKTIGDGLVGVEAASPVRNDSTVKIPFTL